MFSYAKSWLTGKKAATEEEESKGAPSDKKASDGAVSDQDVLSLFMPSDMQEEMFCFTMGDCELHKLVQRHNGQMKECEFLHTSVHVTSM